MEVSGTSNGHLNLSLAKCTSVIGDLNLRFEGGLVADVGVNSFKAPIENIIKDRLETEVIFCLSNLPLPLHYRVRHAPVISSFDMLW